MEWQFLSERARTRIIEQVIRVVVLSLAFLVVLGMGVVLSDEVVRFFRGWRNREGTFVSGWNLEKKEIFPRHPEFQELLLSLDTLKRNKATKSSKKPSKSKGGRR